MRRLRLLLPSNVCTAMVFVFITAINIISLSMPLYSQAIIIDHNCTDVNKIPANWIDTAKSMLRCSYGHTSHGSQLITGMSALMDDAVIGSPYKFNMSGEITAGVLSIADYTPDGDLGNPDLTTWASRTRTYLNGAGSDRNVVMWSWCGQVSSATSADITTYLNLMNDLENDFPDVTFVYMTGHLDGSGVSGNLNVRNNQIRNWCKANNKILFDFADIESYDPSGSYFLDRGADDGCNYSGGNWAGQWLTAHPNSELARIATACGSCAHSETLNCVLKGRAVWWLMARIAGWSGSTTTQPTITVTSPNGGENWVIGSSHTIYWGSTGSVGNVMIEYSTDNGSSWTTIISSTANDGSHSWTVPNTPSTQCRVRISETDGSPTDTGNAVFTISETAPTATITLTSPNGGENWKVGTSQAITWTTTGSVGNVAIKYSANNGGSWTKITASTPNTGSFTWTVPNTPSTQCRVRISETDGSPSDVSDAVFTISGGSLSPSIKVTSPNGGEQWPVGTAYKITWSTTGSVGNVIIRYSINNGGSWIKITASTPNTGSYSWTVPNTPSQKCLVKVLETDGSPTDVSDGLFSIIQGTAPKICVNRGVLYFGYVIGGKIPHAQWLNIYNCGGGTLNWTAKANAGWIIPDPLSGVACDPGAGKLSVSIDPKGKTAGDYTGTITITDPNAANSPVKVTVNLKVKESAKDKSPLGRMETPTDNAVVYGAIPVTGWALDDVDVENVKIYREEYGDLIYIGDAIFIEGARPDIESSYPTSPCSYKAGWGYMLLTNFLPNRGNGHFVLHGIAKDSSGKSTTLGTRKIIVDNANAVKPFGTIDTPGQGDTATGSFKNWGWVLTPRWNHIPTDGSTVAVFVDGVKLGHPTYNIYRSDIAGLFPDYANSNGAVGCFSLDTTSYENGLHTIHWIASDNAGNLEGIGSRYFNIENASTGKSSSRASSLGTFLETLKSSRPDREIIADTREFPGPVKVLKGYNPRVEEEAEMEYPDGQGIVHIEIKALERVELHFFETGNEEPSCGCYLIVGRQPRPLPVGTTFDSERGILYWQVGLGFRGEYHFLVLVQNQNREVYKKEVLIEID